MRQALTNGAVIPLKSVQQHLGATGAEAKQVALALVSEGTAALVQRGTAQLLVLATAGVLSADALQNLRRHVAKLHKWLETAAKQKVPTTVLDSDAREELDGLAPSAPARSPSSKPDSMQRLLAAVELERSEQFHNLRLVPPLNVLS